MMPMINYRAMLQTKLPEEEYRTIANSATNLTFILCYQALHDIYRFNEKRMYAIVMTVQGYSDEIAYRV